MFRFGDRHGFDKRCARQLVVETPFQWWVINLDDGFAETAKPDKYFINLSDIRSTPDAGPLAGHDRHPLGRAAAGQPGGVGFDHLPVHSRSPTRSGSALRAYRP